MEEQEQNGVTVPKRAAMQFAMKSSHNLSAFLWRKIALDVGDEQNQNAQQDHDFDDIVEKELETSPHLTRRVQPTGFHRAADQAVQPFHTQDFILEEVPSRL